MSASSAYYSKEMKPRRNTMLYNAKNATIVITLVVITFLIFFPPDNSDASSSKTKYMAVIDAGSSGCRIHVYKYSGSIKSKKVEPDHATMKAKPGLSSFASNPTEAGAALEPLIKFAKEHIPADMVKSTPIVLKATAGLRLVQQDQPAAVDGILKSVQTTLGNSGLQFEPSNAQIISGQEEGMLGWIALNYLYETTSKSSNLRKSTPVWSVLEMGGASVQVSVPLTSSKGVPSEYVLPYVSPTNGRKGSMYTHSFLGAGVQSAKGAVEQALLAKQGSTDSLNHPCLPNGFTETENSIAYKGTGNFDECQAIIKSAVFAKQQDKVATCEKTSSQCFWNGVAGPGLKPSEQKVWAFENFFYTMSGVGEMKADESAKEFTIQHYEKVAKEMCNKPWDAIESAYPKDSQPKEYNKDWCFSALYAFSFLTSGLGLDAQQSIMIGNEVEGVGIDWALGAVLQHQGRR
ncbi:unnamed protein product [Cylindrotheca closterium]|uniref:Apyrase n=1 Tax=Cylindrotheca closterium TaxID=2856 RepID=A0AAD2FEI7_9STRA|nr:unnamed protein product [Cylindrotheca closterium]